jgi:aldehyde dehydrogenase (NAD+)
MHMRDAFFIGGQWATPMGSDVLEVVSPSSEEVIGCVPASTREDMDAAVAAARKAFDVGPWPHLTVVERGRYLQRMAEILMPNLEGAVRLQIDEMGSPYTFMRAATADRLRSIPNEINVVESINTEEFRTGGGKKCPCHARTCRSRRRYCSVERPDNLRPR